jgi:hypothetical protein
MSFRFGKNLLKLLDNAHSGLLTLNKLLISSNNFQGVCTNILIDEMRRKDKKENIKKGIKIEEKIKTSSPHEEIKKEEVIELKKSSTTKITPEETTVKINIKTPEKEKIFSINTESIKPISNNENQSIETEFKEKENLIKQTSNILNNTNTISINNDDKSTVDPFLIRSDKLHFTGKPSKIPVSSFSRALNFGFLGISMIGSGITNMVIDKVTYCI